MVPGYPRCERWVPSAMGGNLMALSIRGSLLTLCAGLLLTVAPRVLAADPELRWIRSDAASGTTAAVVVDAKLPLAHTAQLWPLDERGKIVGPGRADVQP